MGVSEDPVFPGGMLFDEDLLLVAHFDGDGGITRVLTSGTSATSGQVIGQGMDSCSIVRAPTAARSYAIGRSGDLSGINRVDRLDATGLIEGGLTSSSASPRSRSRDDFERDSRMGDGGVFRVFVPGFYGTAGGNSG